MAQPAGFEASASTIPAPVEAPAIVAPSLHKKQPPSSIYNSSKSKFHKNAIMPLLF